MSRDSATIPYPRDEVSARHRHLAVAAELVEEHFAGEPAPAHLVAHVRLADVAERLNVGRTTLYSLWPSQFEFWHDLVVYCTYEPIEALTSVLADGAAIDDPLQHLALRMAEVEEALVVDESAALRAGLAGYPHLPTTRHAVAAAERRERAAVASNLATLLGKIGRRPIAPLDAYDLATAVLMLLDGLMVCARTDLSMLEWRHEIDGVMWSLSGLAARVVVLELSEPAPSASSGEPRREWRDHDTSVSIPDWSTRQLAALAAGRDLVRESMLSPDPEVDTLDRVLGHVTLDRLARVVGVTRRQMYHLWPNQGEFRKELLDHLLNEGRRDYRRRVEGVLDERLLADPQRAVLHLVDRVNHHRREGEPPPAPELALQPHARCVDVNDWGIQRVRRAIRFHEDTVAATLAMLGGSLRHGLTAHDAAAVLTLGAAGSERLHRTDPDALTYDTPWRGGRYSLFAILNQALCDHLMSPGRDVSGDGDGSEA